MTHNLKLKQNILWKYYKLLKNSKVNYELTVQSVNLGFCLRSMLPCLRSILYSHLVQKHVKTAHKYLFYVTVRASKHLLLARKWIKIHCKYLHLFQLFQLQLKVRLTLTTCSFWATWVGEEVWERERGRKSYTSFERPELRQVMNENVYSVKQ